MLFLRDYISKTKLKLKKIKYSCHLEVIGEEKDSKKLEKNAFKELY